MMVNKLIDHTLLKQDATYDQIKTLTDEAKQYDFKSVCVNTSYVKDAAKLLEGSDVLVCTTIGFPLGMTTTNTKVFEAKEAIENGAQEIDMVINVGALKDKKYDYVLNEIKAVKEAIGDHVLKVIIETCLLTKEEIVKASELVVEAKADFVKTSTGFSTGGATVEDVKLMKETVQDKIEVKAAGGVRSIEDLHAMVDAGATRIGTSGGVKLMAGE
ncbi:MAG: deoxyribose-phosphate aldolase, partial [Erysipelothrix sp.]|nr:deoxyribose-phosphate aldolase [Erysipelothrix sp.]